MAATTRTTTTNSLTSNTWVSDRKSTRPKPGTLIPAVCSRYLSTNFGPAAFSGKKCVQPKHPCEIVPDLIRNPRLTCGLPGPCEPPMGCFLVFWGPMLITYYAYYYLLCLITVPGMVPSDPELISECKFCFCAAVPANNEFNFWDFFSTLGRAIRKVRKK